MQTLKDYLLAVGVEVPAGALTAGWFRSNDLPIFVACRYCGATMQTLRAYVDGMDGYICAGCAGVDKP